jgi:hypothetical protein
MMNRIDGNVADETALDAELLAHIRSARIHFTDLVCTASIGQDEALLTQLRGEPTYLMAEFLYSFRAYGIQTADDIERFADLHNGYVDSLTRDPNKLRRLGLTQERALAGIFTADTKPRLVQNWKEVPGTIDQSNLARFLLAIMSTETCRKTVIDFEKAGFLTRSRSAYGTMLVRSTGVVEDLFSQMLHQLRQSLVACLRT